MVQSHVHEQLKALAIIGVVLLFVVQLLFLSQQFDAFHLANVNGASDWRFVFAYSGKLAKLCVLFVFLLLVALHDHILGYWTRCVKELKYINYVLVLCFQCLLFAIVYWLSSIVFTSDSLADQSVFRLLAWLFTCIFWFSASLYSVFSGAFLCFFFRTQWQVIVLVGLLAVCVWRLASWSEALWGPLSDYTFIVSIALLALMSGGEVYANFELRELGLDQFAVHIAPACSGYEGIGLVCSFIGLYLYVHRHEFRFPQAWLLFPIGAIVIWLLNALRIAVLILIGEYWSPSVAVGGFHSQAGWLMFILASLLILWLASTFRFFSLNSSFSASVLTRENHSKIDRSKSAGFEVNSSDISIASLVPMVVLLAVILLTEAFSSGFDWLYPLRVIAVLIAIWWVWPKLGMPLSLKLGTFFNGVLSVAAGFIVFGFWVFMLTGQEAQYNQAFVSELGAIGGMGATVWFVFRFIGTAVTVPIAEELAFRGYMLCKLSRHTVCLDKKIPLSVIAIVVSSFAFGFLHGAWLEGTLAGVIYAVIRLYTGHIVYAMYAHAVTNILLFIYASVVGEWHLL